MFTGETTEADLASAFESNGITDAPTAEQISASHTSEIRGEATLYAGSLEVRDNAVLTAGGITVLASAETKGGTRVLLNNGTLNATVSLASDTTLEVSGTNYMQGKLIMEDGSRLVLSQGHAAVAPRLELTEFTLNGSITIDVSNLTGELTLMSLPNDSPTLLDKWTETNVKVTGASFDDLKWHNNTLYFNHDDFPGESLTWTGAVDDTWRHNYYNWRGSNDASVYFHNGDSVIFNGGIVSISGEVRPSSVSVRGDVTFNGDGCIAGSAKLTKNGSGTLTMNAKNTYTGGTDITGGTVIATSADSLGAGVVELRGGTLNLDDYAVKNTILATGGRLTGMSNFGGSIGVDGDVNITGEFSAAKLEMTGGSLGYADYMAGNANGCNIRNTPILATSGSIWTTITGTSSLTSSGNVSLHGDNSYTGGTTVRSGVLQVHHRRALGNGAILVQGGTIDTTYTDALTATSLTLDGGMIITKLGAISLSGALNIQSATRFNLGALDPGNYTVLRAAEIAGDTELLVLSGSKNTYEWSSNGGLLMLSLKTSIAPTEPVDPIDPLRPGESLWDIRNDGQEVNFRNPGSVTITGNVEPGAISVDLDGELEWNGRGSVGGSAPLIKEGDGKLTINTANSYTGGTVIHDGTVVVGNDQALGSGAVTLNKGKLAINGHDLSQNALKFNDTAEVNGGDDGKLKSLDLSTPGILDQDGSLLFGGKLTLSGSIRMQDLHAGKGNIAGGSLQVTRAITAESGTIAADLSGTASFTKNGRGTVTLKGFNSWTGTTTLNDGKLVIDGQSSLTSLTINGGSLAITADGSLTLNGLLTLANAESMDFTGKTTTISLGSIDSQLESFLATNGYTLAQEDDLLVLLENLPVTLAGDVIATAPAPAAPTAALAQSAWGTARAAKLFTDAVRDQHQAQAASLDDQGSRSAWFSALSSFSRIGADGAAAGADAEIYGGMVGLQVNGQKGTNAGLAVGQTWGHISPMGTSYVTQKTQHAAVYGSKAVYNKGADSVRVAAVAAYGSTDADTTQDGHRFDWAQQSASATLRATATHAFAKGTSVYGFVGTSYLATNSGNTENGSTGSVQDWQMEAGAGLQHSINKVTLYADASFAPSIVRHNPVAESGDQRGGASNPGRLKLHVSAGASYRLNEHWNLNASYGYDAATHENNHTANIGAACTF